MIKLKDNIEKLTKLHNYLENEFGSTDDFEFENLINLNIQFPDVCEIQLINYLSTLKYLNDSRFFTVLHWHTNSYGLNRLNIDLYFSFKIDEQLYKIYRELPFLEIFTNNPWSDPIFIKHDFADLINFSNTIKSANAILAEFLEFAPKNSIDILSQDIKNILLFQ